MVQHQSFLDQLKISQDDPDLKCTGCLYTILTTSVTSPPFLLVELRALAAP